LSATGSSAPARDRILLAHGGGGELMRELIRQEILPALGGERGAILADSALLADLPRGPLAFTTDSYVVKPLFFPGGDIGRLAVSGTVNDLAVVGARPRALSLAFIVEEGFPLADFRRVLASVGGTAREAGAPVVTGDVKVVERGGADGLFINTAGVGVVPEGVRLGAERVEPGDSVLLSGPIGNHGVAVLSAREGIAFETTVESDVAPLGGLAEAVMTASGASVHWMRDPTRGGLAATLAELAEDARVELTVTEARIPVLAGVRAACELLGLDPLVVANEGKLVAVVSAGAAEAALAALQRHRLGAKAALIGRVSTRGEGRVVLETRSGGRRLVELPYGEELPRIC
jgi:hydrogenase expression/formation protein HypE